jgi:uncharacterized RDD family membrane protein YckC
MAQPPDEPIDEQPTVAWTPPDKAADEAEPGTSQGQPPDPPAAPPSAPAPAAAPTAEDPGAEPASPLISWAPSGGTTPAGNSPTDAGAAGAASGAVAGWEAPDAGLPPSGVAGYRIAGVGSRLVAWFLDNILIAFLTVVISAIVFAIVGSAFLDDTFATTAMSAIILTGIEFLYFVGFWTGGSGATPGMRLLKLRLVAAGGSSSLDIGPAVIRWLAFGAPIVFLSLFEPTATIASWALLLWLVALLVTTGMSPTRQGLHDRWAGSSVVQPSDASANTALIGCLVIALILIGVFILLPIVGLIMFSGQLEEILSSVGQSI